VTGPRHARRRVAAVLLAASTVLLGCSGGGGGSKAAGGSATTVVRGLEVPANEGIKGVMAVRVTSNAHTLDTVDYDIHPPAGGPHNPTPAPCGFYDQAIPDEYVVHTLEHGGVWFAYSPTLAAADIARLHTIVDQNDDLIATPYTGLADGVAVVVTAWARQLTLTSVDDPRLEAFYKKYRNGSQAPEASIACPRLQGQ
jgi:hypothetical protein